ncbi:ankyrin repeat and SOCS box protein 18 isoform X2 [Triplophysa dalaica]|uniref:ankyrin repeat and SOCS box protein 18 isoform X2 n=1 Tax=Triplophysa dalaica TaxID=1582913 RepID=UPI0024DF7370|nr:ankyrin repeat and SOCS box protein 18 isoform X2 [Triplophysa dalaica]
MLSQGTGMCAVSRNTMFLTDRRRSSLNSDQRVWRDRSKGYKQPGMDFLCPPVLHDLLTRHWGDMRDGFSDADDLNKVLDFQSEELLWTAQKRGFTDCLQYLLEHGAHPNLIAGGKAALHEACANSNTECVELLLEHGANTNQTTEEGVTSLHLCRTPQSLRCAKALVRNGAKVNLSSEEDDETPLHVAAKHGLLHHAQLYLRFGACVNHVSSSGETPLGVLCGVTPEKTDDRQDDHYLELCHLLLDYGANVNLVDKERRSPLHKAARNVQHKIVELLLDYGADVNAIDYNGCSPLSNVLQSSVVRQEWHPHIAVQTLLNHGSIKVWPQALLKVLTACAQAPKTVEILFNSYDLVPVTSKWVEAIPEDIFLLHRPFYESLFALEYKPRSLQHLCRSALRKHYGEHCHSFIPTLPVPTPLQQYLLLEPEGYID